MLRIIWAFVGVALAVYTVRWLPRDFGSLGIASSYLALAFIAAGGWALAVWRHTTPIRAAAAGLGLAGGLIGLFWPAIEFLFQSIDGGSMLPYSNFVFVVSIAMSISAIVGSVRVASRPEQGHTWLLIATAGTIVVSVIAPDSPPSARREMVHGLPFIAAAAFASWLAAKRSQN